MQPCFMNEDLQEQKLISSPEPVELTPLPIVMVFSGQGAQWPRMGLELIERHATFRSTTRALDARLKLLTEAPPWTIQESIRADAIGSHISDPCRSQPICTAIQIALVDLFRQWGIVTQTVIGHSSGEIAAAYAAGHITSSEAMAIAYYRGLLAARSTFRGAMMAVGLGEQDADAEIDFAGLRHEIRVACKNSPQNCTLSGKEEAIDHLHERLTSSKIFARKLRTNGIAYHSQDMASLGPAYEGFLSRYLDAQEGAKLDSPTPRMISTVTGQEIHVAQTRQPRHWRVNLESPVEFAKGVSTIIKDRGYQYLEIGPHSALKLPLNQITSHKNTGIPFKYVSAMIRGTDSVRTTLNVVGQLFMGGHNIDFSRVNAIPSNDGTISDMMTGKVLTDLPRYPWQHDTVLWNDSRASTEYRFRKHSRHDLLGSVVPGGSPRSSTWRNLLRVKEVPWLADHQLEGSIVFPAAGYLAMIVEAISRITEKLLPIPTINFRSVHFMNALILTAVSNMYVELITDLHPSRLSKTTDSKTWYNFEISSMVDCGASLHASGSVCIVDKRSTDSKLDTSAFMFEMGSGDPERWYKQFAAHGLQYGPRFKPLRAMYFHRNRSERSLMSEIRETCANEVGLLHEESQYVLHPAIIDALLQTGLMADSCGDLARLRAGIPVSIEAFTLQASHTKSQGETLMVHGAASPVGPNTLLLECELRDGKRNLLASMHGVRVAEYKAADAQSNHSNLIFDLEWKPDVDFLQCSSYKGFVDYVHSETILPATVSTDRNLKQLIGILDLILHKKPSCRILDFEASSPDQDLFSKAIRAIARYETSLQRCKTIIRESLAADGSMTTSDSLSRGDGEALEGIDIIVCCKVHRAIATFLANNSVD